MIPGNDGADRRHWLLRPRSIRLLWRLFGAVLALAVLAQLAWDVYGHFGIDGWFGFNALYGFASCVAMVVFAKVLGWWIKRPDDYYRDDD